MSHFTSLLEIDYLGSLLNFCNFKNIDLPPHIAAYLSDESEDSKLSNLFDLASGSHLICSSKENSYDFIYSILPSSNPFIAAEKPCEYILLYFTYPELLLFSPENYIIHLESIQNSLSIIQRKASKLSKELQKEQTENLLISEALNRLTEENSLLSVMLSDKKTAIIELNQQFESAVKEEAQLGVNLRCVVCENNLKNIVFLPCGHIVLCDYCLAQHLKTKPSLSLEKKRTLFCQACKLKVSEARRVSLTK